MRVRVGTGGEGELLFPTAEEEATARTVAEAARARSEAARAEAEAAKVKVADARAEAEAAKVKVADARADAEAARTEAEAAELARLRGELAQQRRR